METSSEVSIISEGKCGEVSVEEQPLAMKAPTKSATGNTSVSITTELSIIADYKRIHAEAAQFKAQLVLAQQKIMEDQVEISRQKALLERYRQRASKEGEIGPDGMVKILKNITKDEIHKRLVVQVELRRFKALLEAAGEGIPNGVNCLKDLIDYVEYLLKDVDRDSWATPEKCRQRDERQQYLLNRLSHQDINQSEETAGDNTTNENTEEEPELVPTQSVQKDESVTVSPRKHALANVCDMELRKRCRKSSR